MWNYTTFLLQQFVALYSQLNNAEIHVVVFDDSKRVKNHPKGTEFIETQKAFNHTTICTSVTTPMYLRNGIR